MKFSFLKSYRILTAKLLFGFAFLAILNLTAFAQSSPIVSGKVTREGEPEKAVVVTLAARGEIRFTTTTNDAGEFRFENVPAGSYVLSADVTDVSKTLLSAQTELNLTAGQTATSDLNLEPRARALGKVVVTASGTNQTVDETSKAISIVTERELEERGEVTIAEALETVPGLRFQQLGGFGRLASIKTRGLRNQDTAVLIDGQRFRDPAAITGDASPFLSDLTVTNLERVEVLRGSGSSLYGTNAIGGAINILTEEGGGEPRVSLEGEGGGLGLVRGQARIAGGLNQDRFKYSAGIAHNNFGKGIDGNDAARNTSGQGRAAFDLGANTELSFRFYGADAFVELNSSPTAISRNLPASGIVKARALSGFELERYENGAPLASLNLGDATFIPDANDSDARQSSNFAAASVNFEQQLSQRFGYSLGYNVISTRRRNSNGALGAGFQFPGRNRNDGDIHTLRARADFAVNGANTVTAGYEFESENFGSNSTNATQRSSTFFVQDQIRAFDRRLQLSAAFRVQQFDLSRPRFAFPNAPYQTASLDNPPTAYTGDGSATYFFRASNTKLRAHVGNGYRVPSLFERFGESFGAIGSPILQPELSTAFDAGIDQTFGSDRVRLSATYFYTNLRRVVGFGFGSFPRCFFAQPERFGRCNGYFNTNGGVARGAEFSAEFKPLKSLDVFASYTLTNSDQRTPQVANSGVFATLGIPAHQFTAVVTQRFGERFFVNFDLVVTNSYLGSIFPRVYRFGGLRKADLNASYEIPTRSEKIRLRLFAQIEDLFNQEYYENGFRTQNIAGRAGLAVNF